MMQPFHTTFITTVNHNVGDDFVREGLKYLLRQSIGEMEFTNIHKHAPITARYGFEKWRHQKKSSRFDNGLPLWLTRDRIIEADFVVQSGAPVYWCHEQVKSHCWQNEWYTPLIRRRFAANNGAKLLNLAAGSCQTFFSDGSEFCDSCNEYIQEFYNASALTTVRDKLAATILNNIGLDAPLIPCSSIFAIDEYKLVPQEPDYVAVNFMPLAAHYDFGQNINQQQWHSAFSSFYYALKEKERLIFVCHDRMERDAALTIDPQAEIFYEPNDFLAYMKIYSRAKYGILNRVHGAFMIASFGRPSFVVGNDTRARMVEEIGLQCAFVHDATADMLLDKAVQLSRISKHYREQFGELKERSRRKYDELLASV